MGGAGTTRAQLAEPLGRKRQKWDENSLTALVVLATATEQLVGGAAGSIVISCLSTTTHHQPFFLEFFHCELFLQLRCPPVCTTNPGPRGSWRSPSIGDSRTGISSRRLVAGSSRGDGCALHALHVRQRKPGGGGFGRLPPQKIECPAIWTAVIGR